MMLKRGKHAQIAKLERDHSYYDGRYMHKVANASARVYPTVERVSAMA